MRRRVSAAFAFEREVARRNRSLRTSAICSSGPFQSQAESKVGTIRSRYRGTTKWRVSSPRSRRSILILLRIIFSTRRRRSCFKVPSLMASQMWARMRFLKHELEKRFDGGRYWPETLKSLDEEVERFHEMLGMLAQHLRNGDPLLDDMTEERLLQGPFSDAMTHAGQLALLRRLAGAPVPPENFIVADIKPERLGIQQAAPVSPDKEWLEAPAGWSREK